MEIHNILYTTAAVLFIIIGASYIIRLYFEHKELKINLKQRYQNQYQPLIPSPKLDSTKPTTNLIEQISPIKSPSSTVSPNLVKIVGKLTKLKKENTTSTPKTKKFINDSHVELGSFVEEPSHLLTNNKIPPKRQSQFNKTIQRLHQTNL